MACNETATLHQDGDLFDSFSRVQQALGRTVFGLSSKIVPFGGNETKVDDTVIGAKIGAAGVAPNRPDGQGAVVYEPSLTGALIDGAEFVAPAGAKIEALVKAQSAIDPIS